MGCLLENGDSLADNIMESPARSESASCFRDEIISQYSPMSEDSDDYRYYDTQLNPNGSQTDAVVSPSTSPMSSPHRFQKPYPQTHALCPAAPSRRLSAPTLAVAPKMKVGSHLCQMTCVTVQT